MRRFVVIGRTATASPDFLLRDLPGTSGRLDVLLRCVRAALLVSHGIRKDTLVYLVLLGGASAPRSLRIDGAATRYVRPDEYSLATTVKKALSVPIESSGFVFARTGIWVARGGLEVVLADLPPLASYVLDIAGSDIRSAPLDAGENVFFLGDHLGLDPETRRQIDAFGAQPIGLGPVGVHADDAITLVGNELDRRTALG
jgi:tRNA (pseudouridine54-N1)-methyltransferase